MKNCPFCNNKLYYFPKNVISFHSFNCCLDCNYSYIEGNNYYNGCIYSSEQIKKLITMKGFI